MTITEAREKCKSFAAQVPRDVFTVVVLVLASSLSFWFGYLAGRDVEQGSGSTLEEAESVVGIRQVVASKNGTKYYLPECTGADRISPANKVWFPSVAAAVNAGYSPATNCPGI